MTSSTSSAFPSTSQVPSTTTRPPPLTAAASRAPVPRTSSFMTVRPPPPQQHQGQPRSGASFMGPRYRPGARWSILRPTWSPPYVPAQTRPSSADLVDKQLRVQFPRPNKIPRIPCQSIHPHNSHWTRTKDPGLLTTSKCPLLFDDSPPPPPPPPAATDDHHQRRHSSPSDVEHSQQVAHYHHNHNDSHHSHPSPVFYCGYTPPVNGYPSYMYTTATFAFQTAPSHAASSQLVPARAQNAQNAHHHHQQQQPQQQPQAFAATATTYYRFEPTKSSHAQTFHYQPQQSQFHHHQTRHGDAKKSRQSSSSSYDGRRYSNYTNDSGYTRRFSTDGSISSKSTALSSVTASSSTSSSHSSTTTNQHATKSAKVSQDHGTGTTTSQDFTQLNPSLSPSIANAKTSPASLCVAPSVVSVTPGPSERPLAIRTTMTTTTMSTKASGELEKPLSPPPSLPAPLSLPSPPPACDHAGEDHPRALQHQFAHQNKPPSPSPLPNDTCHDNTTATTTSSSSPPASSTAPSSLASYASSAAPTTHTSPTTLSPAQKPAQTQDAQEIEESKETAPETPASPPPSASSLSSTSPLPVWADPVKVQQQPARYKYVQEYMGTHGLDMHAAELPLPRPVAFYFSDTSKQHHRHGGKSQYRDAVRRVCECATVWQFCARWRYQQQHLGYHPSRLPDHRTLYCFVDGVEPAWEDPVNKHGGRLALAINDRSQIDLLWDWILASFVGGNLDDHGIVGIVAARRYRGDRIEIWFDKTASDNTMPAFKSQLLQLIPMAACHEMINNGRFKKHL